jgi:AcrR family transcriptional regulator
VEGVAARSGVGKASIYRRYAGKEELALALLLDWLEGVRAPADLGDTRKELMRFSNEAVRLLGSTLTGDVVRGLVSELAASPELARVYRERIVEPRIRDVQIIVDRGVDRGDLRPDTDARVAHELMIGPIFYRLLFSGGPIDRALSTRLADAILDGFSVATKTRPGRR